jgi:hypothetical protein
MPENETLSPDARTASRWQPLRDRVAGGESPDQIFPDLQEQFYRSLRRVFKQWKARGVDPKQLLEAAVTGPAALNDLVARARNDEFARLLQDAIAGEKNPNLEVVVRSFLDSVWEQVRGQLQVDCREDGVSDTFLSRVGQMLERLVMGLLKDPSRVPRRPPNKESPPDIDDILDEPLPLG